MKKRPINTTIIRDILEKDGFISGYLFEDFRALNFEKINTFKLTRICFYHCDFNGNFDLHHLQNEDLRIEFTNCSFKENNLRIHHIKVKTIQLKDCDFGSLNLSEGASFSVNIQDTEITEDFIIHEWQGAWIQFKNKPGKELKILHVNAPKLESFDMTVESKILWAFIQNVQEALLHGILGTIKLHENFKHIEISGYQESSSKTYVHSRVDEVTFIYSTFGGQLLIEDAHIGKLDFRGLTSDNGHVRLNEISIDETVITECAISRFFWNQVRFNTPPEISGSDLSGLKMSNVFWPNDYRLKDSFLDEKIPLLYGLRLKQLKKEELDYAQEELSMLKYQRETYRQLKAASLANHNQIEALAFYKNEMRLYWKEIRLEGGIAWYDRLLVFLNRWVSDFGQSWHMPLLWLLAFHLLFFSCVMDWSYFSNQWSGSEELGQYFNLLNPVHKTPDYINTGWGNVTEFFMRVMGGFFIYHFIRATRKFGKV